MHLAQGGQPIRLEVDGGIKVENIAAAAAAGADTFVAGSAIFSSPDGDGRHYNDIFQQFQSALSSAN